MTFSLHTETATLVVFDLASLQHRIDDAPDWWSLCEDELAEINNGNALFLNLGEDGCYNVSVVEQIGDNSASLFLKVPSGKVFIGAGEDTSGGDLEPDNSPSVQGRFLTLQAGYYEVKFQKIASNITLSFSASDKHNNELETPVRL